jgi:hypothetical protein
LLQGACGRRPRGGPWSDQMVNAPRLCTALGLALGVLLGGGLCAPRLAAAQAAPTVFGCDAAGRRTCYFTVTTPGGVQSFSLSPGRRRVIGGLTPRRDSYVVSYGAPSLGDEKRCRQMAALSRGCDHKMVDPDYND